jgi:hypothetical protein
MRITKQTIRPDPGDNSPAPDFDVKLNSSEEIPPAILLDYTYGVAAYACWQSESSEEFRSAGPEYTNPIPWNHQALMVRKFLAIPKKTAILFKGIEDLKVENNCSARYWTFIFLLPL